MTTAGVTWPTIKAYFTDMDVDHMKQVSANWPAPLDLHDEASVLHYAAQVHNAVKSGSMPIGEPRWTDEMVSNFEIWWKSQEPGAQFIG